jgi:hypothetical protein
VPQEAFGVVVAPVCIRAEFCVARESSRGEMLGTQVVSRGTDGSNPASSSGESSELRYRDYGTRTTGIRSTKPCECARSLELRFSFRMPKMVPTALQSTL